LPRARRGREWEILETEVRGRAALRLVVRFWIVCMALAWPPLAAAQGLFVVSQANEKILHYDETDGSFVETFVEAITEGFQNPGGIAIRPSDGVLYVTSTGTGEIWTYTTATGQVITPEIKSGLISPGGADFDASGAKLYFLAAETDLSTGTDGVFALTISSGNVSTLATDRSANFSALAVNGTDLFVTDTFNNQVTRYPISGGGSATVVTGLSQPGGIVFGSPTQMLVANTGTDEVFEYDLISGSWVFDQVVLASTAGVDGPTGLAMAPDTTLTVTGQFSNNVISVNLTTLNVTTLVQTGAGGLTTPKEIAWSGNTLLVSSLSTNSIIYYDDMGTPTGVVAKGISTPSDSGMVFSPGGNLVAGSIPDNDLVEYDGDGGAVIRKFFDACPTSFDSPFDVAFGPDGNIHITCSASSGVFRFNAATGNPMGFFVTQGSGGLSNPRGLAFGSNGNLFVSSGLTGEILEYDGTTGALVGVFVDNTGNGGGPVDPWGIAFHEGSSTGRRAPSCRPSSPADREDSPAPRRSPSAPTAIST
jgi:WD40 repeat protein